MRKIIFVALAIAAFGFTGCTSMKYNHASELKQLDWPVLNRQTTVFVGDKMLVQGHSLTSKTLQVYNFFNNGTCYYVPPGVYTMLGDDDNRYYFSNSGSNGGVIRSGACYPSKGITVPKNKPNKICVLMITGINACFNGEYSIVESENDHLENHQQSLIYSGLDDSQIKFEYLETKGGRIAYSHSATYDLRQSNVINYRGARIQIHRATNEAITYSVLSNFPNKQQ